MGRDRRSGKDVPGERALSIFDHQRRGAERGALSPGRVGPFVVGPYDGARIGSFSPKTAAITTFALTGLANLSSLGILLGGLGGLAPSRRSEIAQLGLKAILGGTLANLMSAAIAGILLG